jgi:hypothetical protein
MNILSRKNSLWTVKNQNMLRIEGGRRGQNRTEKEGNGRIGYERNRTGQDRTGQDRA